MADNDRLTGPSDFIHGPVPISREEVENIVSDVLLVLMERVSKTCGVELVEEDDIIDDASSRLNAWFESHFTVS